MAHSFSLQCSCDDRHLVDFLCVAASGEVVDRSVESEQDRSVSSIAAVCVAASGEVVDRSVESEQDRSVSSIAAESLSDLVADVACLDDREYECVRITCYRGTRELQLADCRRYSRVELHLAVDGHVRVELLGDLCSLCRESNGVALAGALCGEAEHRYLRVDAESPCALLDLYRYLSELLSARECNVALFVLAVPKVLAHFSISTATSASF